MERTSKKTSQMRVMRLGHRTCTGMVVAALGLLLGGCDARFTSDLGTDAPADPSITGVRANVLGLDLRKADGTDTTLEFRTGELVNLLDFQDGSPLRLFTDESLPAGSYTGVRLLFDEDEDQNAVTTGGGEFPLLLAEGDFAAIDFTIEEDDRSEQSITLVADLRQSLSFDEDADEYTLTPRLRAVTTDDGARIEGIVTVTCPTGTALISGGAIYLFSGADVEPDDLDGADAEPFATTRVLESTTGGFRFALSFLPAGQYTLALTCRGNEDLLGVDDTLDFVNIVNVEVEAGDVLQLDLV